MASRIDSDEFYVINLCDEILGMKAKRQMRFDELLGDTSPKTGRRIKIPVDAYFEALDLAIEYQESQHYSKNKHFDKPTILTVSGVHRGEQRKIYDQRKAEFLGGRLLIIKSSDFKLKGNRIDRALYDQNKAIVGKILKSAILRLDNT